MRLAYTVKGVLVVAGTHTEVFGIYRSDVQAGLAVVRLMESGFPSGDISVLLHDHRSRKTSERAAKSTTADHTFGFLGQTSPLEIPGAGPFIVVGPMMATLAGAGAGGDLASALIDMGIAEFEARRYEGKIKEGAVLLSVRCDSSVSVTRAKNLFKQMGGQDIASSGDAGAGRGAAPPDGPGGRECRRQVGESG